MIPIAEAWLDIAERSGLSFVLLDQHGVAFIGINDVVGWDENVASSLKLNRNGCLRRQIRNAFEKNDPMWQRMMALRSRNELIYGSAMSGISATRRDLQGRAAAWSLGILFWGLWLHLMAQRSPLTFYLSDCTHYKTIASTRHPTMGPWAQKILGRQKRWLKKC